MSKAIGIDLGTAYSRVAVFHDGKIQVIANSWGNRATPSVVAYTANGLLVGETATKQIDQNLENTIYSEF